MLHLGELRVLTTPPDGDVKSKEAFLQGRMSPQSPVIQHSLGGSDKQPSFEISQLRMPKLGSSPRVRLHRRC